jgi:hypothetical protein
MIGLVWEYEVRGHGGRSGVGTAEILERLFRIKRFCQYSWGLLRPRIAQVTAECYSVLHD